MPQYLKGVCQQGHTWLDKCKNDSWPLVSFSQKNKNTSQMAAICSEWLIADVVKYSEVFCYNKASVCFFFSPLFVKKEWHCTHWQAAPSAMRLIVANNKQCSTRKKMEPTAFNPVSSKAQVTCHNCTAPNK